MTARDCPLLSYDNSDRDKILRQLRNAGLSIREIERATGISRGVIAMVNKRIDE